MIDKYINYLYNDLLKYRKHMDIKNMDIIFEGGLFNGGYLLGVLEYIKFLETKDYIVVNRISGTSVGSIIGLLYFIEYSNSDIDELISSSYNHFRTKYNVNIFDKIFSYLKTKLTQDMLKKINNKLYISYFDLKKNKHIVKKTYKNIDVLLDTIRKSCSMPIVIDNNLTYKNRYIDGLYPYLFNPTKNTRILYLNIHTFDKLFNMIKIKNEKTSTKRILVGVMDLHNFLSTGNTTNICSFVDSWTLIDNIKYTSFIYILNIYYYLVYKVYLIKKHKIFNYIYIYLLKTFCL